MARSEFGAAVQSFASDPWPNQIFRTLTTGGYTQFCYVPDSGHRTVIELAHAATDVNAVPLTCEEEGVAILAGAYLGGAKAVLLMQSSGVGNCVNFLSLIKHARFPFLALVTMRGDYGEQNSWQYPMGQAAEAALRLMGVVTIKVDRPEDVLGAVEAAVGMADPGGQAVAVLLGQKLIGAKPFAVSGHT